MDGYRRQLQRQAAASLCALLIAAPAMSAETQAEILDRLQRLEARQAALELEVARKDQEIEALRRSLAALSSSDKIVEETVAARADAVPATADTSTEAVEIGEYGEFQPGGRGFKLADTSWGDVNFSAWTYARYLNQQALDETYTDAFGRTFELDLRQDVQLNKVNLYFKGHIYDPRLQYLFYVWTANTNQGEGAQVVVAGNLGWEFNEAFSLSAGIGGLPGTKSLRGTFPYWLKVDTRPIGEEFFRPSYTSGVWARGTLAEGLKYHVMLGNNLSQLGVSAAELDAGLNTFSAALWWMPSTGEFGPAGGFGDFTHHEQLATSFGIHYTRSREDRQSQPGLEDIQNTQLRLSDGTLLFRPGAFGTEGRINKATYQMSALNAGMKYRGISLSGEYYLRWLDDFKTEGSVPVENLFDHGFQLQASAMLIPRTLQPYFAGSVVFGEYGDPWDAAVGVNWYPTREQLFRINAELLYLKDSPVGYSSVPFVVGGNGVVFHTNVEVVF